MKSRVPVTADNFIRAETHRYFGIPVRTVGLGRLDHHREPMSIDDQTVVRANRDTLYSAALFDLEAGPVTLHLPDPGDRFLSMMLLDEDHYVPAIYYDGGTHRLDRQNFPSRYAFAGFRILVDPGNPEDVRKVHALQDAIRVEQAAVGKFEVPDWDPVSQDRIRDALVSLGATLPDMRRAFGKREEVDPIRHFIASAMAWGGNPDRDAVYLNVTPSQNDGKTVYRLKVKDVPVDGFWSISVYNREGYFEKNPRNAYTLNNLTAKRDADGSITVQFGGCEKDSPNCLPICPGWNYMVRLYRPRAEILNEAWKFPQAEAVAAMDSGSERAA